MQPDRFEADLRSALHADAESVKATMTAVELRRRAAQRRSWGALSRYPKVLFGAIVPIAAAVVLAVIVVLNPRTPTPIASTPPSILPSSGPSASPNPSAEASPAAVPFDMGASGSVLVARPTKDQLEIVSIDPSGAERTLTIVALPSAPEGPDWHIEDGTLPIYSFNDGHLVVWVVRQVGESSEGANAWFDLRRSLDTPVILPPGATSFAPDGTLVIATLSQISRIVDLTQPAGLLTPVPDPARFVLHPALREGFEVAADGTGVLIQRLESDDSTWTPVILRWDGSAVGVGGVQPDLATGRPRLWGAGGERIAEFCVDAPTGSHCGLMLEGSGDSKAIEVLGGDAKDAAWTVDGDAVVAIDDRGRVVRWTSTGSRLIGSLPRSGRIVGLTRDAVYVANTEKGGTVTRLPLAKDSSPSTINGVFIRVVP